MPSRVALIRGDSRYDNVRRALDAIADDVRLPQTGTILVKPNFTSEARPLAVTHLDAMRALLDFVRQRRTAARIVVAEGAGVGCTADGGFRSFGYAALTDYGVELADLHQDEPVAVPVFDRGLKPISVRVAKSVVEADFRISICPPKTHDFVIVTAAIKNIVMGSVQRKEGTATRGLLGFAKRLAPSALRSSPLVVGLAQRILGPAGNDKLKMHQGYPVMNLNLYLVAKAVRPHLAVIDGFEAMEGAGPVDGAAVPLGVALASTDAVAADATAARLMGFAPESIGYLRYCAQGGLGEIDAARIEVVGEPVACARPFRPHSTYQAQLRWALPGVEKYI